MMLYLEKISIRDDLGDKVWTKEDTCSREIIYANSHLVIAWPPRVAYQRIVVSGGTIRSLAQYVPRLYLC